MSMIGLLIRATPGQLAKIEAKPSLVDNLLKKRRDETCDVDKLWDVLHYLIGDPRWGGPPELGFICETGTLVDCGVGVSGSRLFQPEMVGQVRTALGALNAEIIGERWDPDQFEKYDIYPGPWANSPHDAEAKKVVLRQFEEMKAFIHETASLGEGLVVVIL